MCLQWDRSVYVNNHKYHGPTLHAHLSNCLLPQHLRPSDFRRLCKPTDTFPVKTSAEITRVSHLSALCRKKVSCKSGAAYINQLCNLHCRDKQQLAGIFQHAQTALFNLPATTPLKVQLGGVHTTFNSIAVP